MPEYKIAFDQKFEDLLDNTAKSKSLAPEASSKSDVIRRAVALYSFLHEQVADESRGLRVALIDKKSKIVKIVDPLP